MLAAAFIAFFAAAALLVVYFVRGRNRRRREQAADLSESRKFDTTLGEFHDMREALRPLQHTRVASRKTPQF